MKRLIIIMLVAMVPFFTMAQKRSSKKKTETTNVPHDFMMITIEEITPSAKGSPEAGSINNPPSRGSASRGLRSKIKVSFDFGADKPSQSISLREAQYKSIAHAINSAVKEGWEFMDANVVNLSTSRLHYFYMKRKK